MIPVPSGVRIYLASSVTDMRKGFNGLSLLVQEHLQRDPFSGQLFLFRGKRGHLVKALWWGEASNAIGSREMPNQGLCLYSKRLEKGRFVWPTATVGAIVLTPAQFAMLIEGIDWRMPERTDRPRIAG